MPLNNSTSSYGSVTKTFHWLTALLLVSAFFLGLFASDTAHDIQSPDFDGSQDTIARAMLLFSLHKTIGISAFFVALARIAWALSQPKPGLLHPDNRPEALAAEVVHWMLYGAMVATPLTGWIHHAATTGFAPIWWPFGQDLPFVAKSETTAELFGTLHWVSGKALQISFLLHVAGALKHVVIDRDATLRRMMPGSRPLPEPPAQKHGATPAFIALVIWAAVFATGTVMGLQSEDHGNHDHGQTNGQKDSTAQSVSEEDAPSAASTDNQPENRAASESGNWVVESGTLGLTIQQMGSGISGSFANWTANIQFDAPVTPGPAGQIAVEIDIASLSLGTVTDQAMGPDYFDSASYPTARFEANLAKLDTGYQAVGHLTIRDKRLPLTLPFTLDLDEDHAVMSGQVSVNRLDFDIGLGTQDAGTLGFDVLIQISLEAELRD